MRNQKKRKVTTHLILTDEAQACEAESFLIQVAPQTTRTSGIIVALGTTIPDASNLLYNFYKSPTIPDERRIIFDWESVYEMKKQRSVEDAEKYKTRVMKEIEKYNINSDYIQTQYYCTFNVVGDRFTTMDRLVSYNVFRLNQYGIENFNFKDFDYIVASFDSARFHDYAAILIGGINKRYKQNTDGNRDSLYYEYTIFEFQIFNEDKKILSPDDLSIMVSDICAKYKIDMIIYDTTAQQLDRAYYLQKEFDKRKINTFIVPLNYSNKKMFMFQTLEDALIQQQIQVPDLSFRETYKAFDEFIEEILYLKKIKKENGKMDFKAPEGEMFRDDLVMIFSQFIYLPIYIKRCLEQDRTVTQNISNEYNKPIKFYKLTETEEEERSGYWRK